MRYLCTVSYKGTAYQGWQKQVDAPTIQGCIEETLSQFFNQNINIQGAGRTDTGVHAKGQTFHFDLNKEINDLSRFLYSINQMLPDDISILNIKQVQDDFHARFSTIGKKYLYIISYGSKDPFENNLKYNCLLNFDHKIFEKCITYFKGVHDFRNFTSKEEDEDNFVREIYKIEVSDSNNEIKVLFEGNGFMRYMIRYIIGTSLACAQGKIGLEEVKKLLDNPVREIVSYKAPPDGLYLLSVLY